MQGVLEEYQEKELPERTALEKGPFHPKLKIYRDSADELTVEKKAHPKKRATEYHGVDWPPNVLLFRLCPLLWEMISSGICNYKDWSLRLSCRS